MAGQNRAYWCSTTDNFDRDGQWSWCTGPGTNSYLACLFPFLYNGVLETTCVLDVAGGYTWCATSANFDRDGKSIYCLEVDFRTSVATIPSNIIGQNLLMDTTPMATEPVSSTSAALTVVPTSPVASPSTVNKDVLLESTTAVMKTSLTTVQTPLPGTSVQPPSSTPNDMGYTTSINIQSPRGGSDLTSMAANSAQPISSTRAAVETLPTSGKTSVTVNSAQPTSSTRAAVETLPTSDKTSVTVNSAQPTNSTRAAVETLPTSGSMESTMESSIASNWSQLTDWLRDASMNLSTEVGLDIIPDLQKYVSTVSPSGLHVDEKELIVYILGNVTDNVVQSNLSFPVSTAMGFFIFIFGCLLDKKVMDLIKKRMSQSPIFSSTATTVTSY